MSLEHGLVLTWLEQPDESTLVEVVVMTMYSPDTGNF
ncbi:5'-nucleotidase [Vibrio cholerae]|nr:5'-nucleotidase [Vibrio cholerae]